MRPTLLTLILLLPVGAGALADDQSDRQKLTGSWELQTPTGNMPATSWTFSPTGNSMRIKQTLRWCKIADFGVRNRGYTLRDQDRWEEGHSIAMV